MELTESSCVDGCRWVVGSGALAVLLGKGNGRLWPCGQGLPAVGMDTRDGKRQVCRHGFCSRESPDVKIHFSSVVGEQA